MFQSLQIYPGLNPQARREMTLYLPLPPNMCQLFFMACFLNLSLAKQKESKEVIGLLSFFYKKGKKNREFKLTANHDQTCIYHRNVA